MMMAHPVFASPRRWVLISWYTTCTSNHGCRSPSESKGYIMCGLWSGVNSFNRLCLVSSVKKEGVTSWYLLTHPQLRGANNNMFQHGLQQLDDWDLLASVNHGRYCMRYRQQTLLYDNYQCSTLCCVNVKKHSLFDEWETTFMLGVLKK
jgi:hypothetical protein